MTPRYIENDHQTIFSLKSASGHLQPRLYCWAYTGDKDSAYEYWAVQQFAEDRTVFTEGLHPTPDGKATIYTMVLDQPLGPKNVVDTILMLHEKACTALEAIA